MSILNQHPGLGLLDWEFRVVLHTALELESLEVWSSGAPSQFTQYDLKPYSMMQLLNKRLTLHLVFCQIISDPFNPIKLEVLDFTSNVIDYQTQTAGFDLQLDGLVQLVLSINLLQATIMPSYLQCSWYRRRSSY